MRSNFREHHQLFLLPIGSDHVELHSGLRSESIEVIFDLPENLTRWLETVYVYYLIAFFKAFLLSVAAGLYCGDKTFIADQLHLPSVFGLGTATGRQKECVRVVEINQRLSDGPEDLTVGRGSLDLLVGGFESSIDIHSVE